MLFIPKGKWEDSSSKGFMCHPLFIAEQYDGKKKRIFAEKTRLKLKSLRQLVFWTPLIKKDELKILAYFGSFPLRLRL